MNSTSSSTPQLTPSPTPNLVSRGLKSTITLCVLAIVLFALNIFVLTPFITKSIGPGAANIFYIGLRLVVLVGLAHLLGRFAQRNRFQTLSTVMIAAFFDQVVLKWFFLLQDTKVNPELWEGVTQAEIAYGVSTGFLFFAPFVLILAFFGYETVPSRLRREKTKDTVLS